MTGKQRAVRIPLDYFKKSDGLTRWKVALAALFFVAPVLWAASFWVRPKGPLDYSRGPLATVHATWEEKCDACHAPFKPINGSAHWAHGYLDASSSAEQKCEACHSGAVHHDKQRPESTPGCGGCHRDHRGRDASLVRLADNDCTRCHQDLNAHMKEGKSEYANVSGFTTDHPEFRSIKADDGRLKFNHKLHLTPGLGVGFTLANIRDPADRKRYQEEKDGVVLDCRSCHQLDAGDFGGGPWGNLSNSFLPKRAAGAYMQPIVYENQCKACHPLNVEPDQKDKAAAPALAGLTVPHRLQPDEVRDFLRGAYAEQVLARDYPELHKYFLRPRPMPGLAMSEAEKKAQELVKEKAALAENFLGIGQAAVKEKVSRAACAECHYFETPQGESTPKRIVPTNVPTVWLKHARFDHVAHRAVDCLACHENARKSEVATDVLMPGIKKCQECHSPASSAGGGARFDCTECHSYHHGEDPLAGLGARARDPKKTRDIKDFLKGE
jgi:predicted CXXCH cytochrome family protein